MENTSHLKELFKGTRVFSNDRRENLLNALSNINSIRVLVWPLHISVVCGLANECCNRYTRYWIPTSWKWQWYSDSISKHSELIQKSNLSGVKGSNWQKLYEASFPMKNIVPICDEDEEDLNNDGNYLWSAVILGAFPKKRNNETLMTVQK